MAGLHFDITGDNKNLLRNLEGSKQGIRSLTREAEKESMNLDDIMKRIGQSAAAIGVGFSATQLIRDVARVRGEFQQLEVALNTMLGSEEKANELFQQLVNTAAKTPFDLKGVAGGAKQLLAYGVAAEEVNDTIIRLGDIAAGLSIPLGDLVYLYGTTMTQGRLFTQDLRQFMGRGIPLADELAKQFGVTKDAVEELVTDGKVGFEEVEKAIRAMTSEGGKFAGLMENQSKTITGQVSNLEDAVDSMFNEIGKSTQGAISGVLSTTTKLVENYREVIDIIGGIVVAFGSYKAVLAATAAFEGASAKAKYSIEAAEILKVLPLKEASAHADIQQAVASGKLTEAEAEKAIAIREEAKAYLEKLEAARIATAHDAAVAMENKRNNQEDIDKLQEQIGKLRELGKTKEADAETTKLQSLMNKQQTLAVEAETAVEIANKAATDAETVSTKINTATQNANTASTNLLTKAKTKLASAGKAVAATLNNPYVLAAAAVAALAFGIYKVVTAKSAEEKAIERVNKEREKSIKQREEEKTKIDELVGIITDDTQTRTAQVRAYKELSALMPSYTKGLSLEAFQAMNVTERQRLLNEELEKARYEEAAKNVETYKNRLQELDAEAKRVGNMTVTNQAQSQQQAMRLKMIAQEQADYKERLRLEEEFISKWNESQEDLKPIETKIQEAKDLHQQAQVAYEAAKKAMDDEIEKLKKHFGEDNWENYTFLIPVTIKSNLEFQEANVASTGQNIKDLEEQQEEQNKKKIKALTEEELKDREKANEQLLETIKNNKQAEIDLIQDEDERKLAQIQFDYEQEKAAIEKQREELRRLRGGKLTKEDEEALRERSMLATQKFVNDTQKVSSDKLVEERNEQQEHYDELLEQYQTYREAEKRINEKYDKDAEDLKKAGGTKENLDILNRQRDSALEQAAEEFASQSEVYQQWLTDIEGMTLDRLNDALAQAKQALDLAKQEESGASAEDIAVATAQVNKLEEKIKETKDVSPKQRSIEEWKALSDVIGEASGVFEELGDSIGDTAGEILKSVGSIGSSTVGLINNITQLTQMSIEGTKETANTASKSVQAVEKASVILAIISAAIQIITKIINLGKQLHNAKFEKAIEASQDKIDDLSKSYENLAEKVYEAFGNTRVQGLKEMNANLERQNALIRQQMEDEAQVKQKDSEYEAAMDDYNAKLEENQKKQEENKKAMEEAIFGEDIQSAIENFTDAYAEALEGNMDMNATAKEQAVRMMKNMVMESIKEYVAGSKKMEQIRAKMDALYADGVFSTADQKLIIDELEQFNKELDDRFGWAEDLFNEEEASSSSSKRGIATASQESVDENNGRLMSIQLSMGEIKEQMIYTVTYLASMSSGVAAGNNILSDIREQAVRTNGHLEDIVKYTKPLNDKISEVVSAVNKINSK